MSDEQQFIDEDEIDNTYDPYIRTRELIDKVRTNKTFQYTESLRGLYELLRYLVIENDPIIDEEIVISKIKRAPEIVFIDDFRDKDPTDFVPLYVNSPFEIMVGFPHDIKNKKGEILKRKVHYDTQDKVYYPMVNIKGVSWYLHRLIASRFIYNDDPDHKVDVDHIDRNTSNYEMSNLVWKTHSANKRNSGSNKFSEVPEDALQLTHYNGKPLPELVVYSKSMNKFWQFDKENNGFLERKLNADGKTVRIPILTPIQDGPKSFSINMDKLLREHPELKPNYIEPKIIHDEYSDLFDYDLFMPHRLKPFDPKLVLK
jgi:hypothetical protein